MKRPDGTQTKAEKALAVIIVGVFLATLGWLAWYVAQPPKHECIEAVRAVDHCNK